METGEQYDLAPPPLALSIAKQNEAHWWTSAYLFFAKKEELHTLIYLVLYWQLIISFPCKEEMHESSAPNIELWRISF
jgi:hypothetical protein